jgi:hypothetical protein
MIKIYYRQLDQKNIITSKNLYYQFTYKNLDDQLFIKILIIF